jgi:hypothetical protein
MKSFDSFIARMGEGKRQILTEFYVYRQINKILEFKLTRSAKRIIKALNHIYKSEAVKRRILKKEVSLTRKRTLEIKEQQATKKLKSKMKSTPGPLKKYIFNEGI